MKRPVELRFAHVQELPELSQLCLRSKAYWGYDEEFMAACVDVLTLHESDLQDGLLIVAEVEDCVSGLAQLAGPPDEMEIDRLFVDPAYIGTGCGRVLFDWCVSTARAKGATRLLIETDPDAASFYEKMGAVLVGETPSDAIPGRMLPLLELAL